MNNEEKNDRLDLSSTTFPSVFNSSGRAVPVSGYYATPDERRIAEEWNKQTMVIHGARAQTSFAAACITEMHGRVSETHREGVERILAEASLPEDLKARDYVEAFSEKQVQLLEKHLWGTLEVGANNIAVEVHRSLYPPPEEPAPKPEPPEPKKEPFSVRRFLFG